MDSMASIARRAGVYRLIMRRGSENASARAPAVAGAFYPADADTLRREVSAFLGAARPPDLPAPPKALIVPHAAYVYSGFVAAAANALLRESRRTVRRVVLIGPSHRVPLAGIAVPEADYFLTPLGTIPLDLPLRVAAARRRRRIRLASRL
jgi:MEMO1 family protein